MRVAIVGIALSVAAALPKVAAAQENTEIQVYGADLVATGYTMVELHSNFTFDGRADTVDGVLPTDHAFHETLEITHGFASIFEVGFYLFTNERAGDGASVTGVHVRPRFRIPASWHLPVGLSLSQEIGYARRKFSPDTWTWEIRPIIDQTIGPVYWSFNPVLEVALHGESSGQAPDFSPNVKVALAVVPWMQLGVEYYGSLGPVTGFDTLQGQEHQLFPAVDFNFSPNVEINAGVGLGLTNATDKLLAKLILGYRFGG
jgi:Putative MetA-pathway of phenol degradation